ncbi:GTP-binding protein [Candidatus Micrarchaeota archaeon]|nr:GTP-binding protein [Candidatus Micrarchaeota archaeon]
MGLADKIHGVEDELSTTKVHKGTEYHVGLLKAKLAKLKKQASSAKSSGGGRAFDVRKSGDSRVVLIGLPSVGKSTLLTKITNAKSEIAAYAFTTLTVIPGVLEYKSARIQILDLPGILSGAAEGTGRGREVLAVARSADLVLLMLDVFQPDQALMLRKELEMMGIRLDKKHPNIVITRKSKGGTTITSTVKRTKLEDRMVIDVLNVYGIHNADVIFREDASVDDLIDVLVENRVYIPTLTVLNKIDLVNKEYLEEVSKRIGPGFIPIAADSGFNCEKVKQAIYEKLEFIRVYMRKRSGEIDYKEPLIMRSNSTVADVCDRIHRDWKKEFKYAQVWGKSAKFGGQKVGLEHKMQDEDVLTIAKK